ncbi:hypothetical protein SAMN04488057_105265 [Cyclobacterium lianum]|uniref:Uncharacterized protein n=1 Tax=Cyclobacterium lianum TaxID=388280 RepID=A0A1M7NG03_9BACT|nr:hypothetical protein [Cyclobacterium lianum]SHN02200.1 hypothetical protein SAMN04488057_105265 [Cyclobacterium lianum]
MFDYEELLAITTDRLLFEKISAAKKVYTDIFSQTANQLSRDFLNQAHPNNKGVKISKGNELQHCPYQVLDVLRDFDPSAGCNIRVLNWWGRGMFMFVFFGKNHTCLRDAHALLEWAGKNRYQICLSDLWGYSEIIDQKKTLPSKLFSEEKLREHLRSYSHLQLMKSLPLLSANEMAGHIKIEIESTLSIMNNLPPLNNITGHKKRSSR